MAKPNLTTLRQKGWQHYGNHPYISSIIIISIKNTVMTVAATYFISKSSTSV
jgi:hypothetical protein